MSERSGAEKALNAAMTSKKLASILKATTTQGIKGMAIQTTIEFFPTIMKFAIGLLILLLLLPYLILSALPNIFFRFDSGQLLDIQQMTQKAQEIESIYKSFQDYGELNIDSKIQELSYGYDDVQVDKKLGNLNNYWFIAICSVAYNQNLFEMNKDDLKQRTLLSYAFDTSEEEYTVSDEETEKVLKRLKISVRELSPDEMMDKLSFTEGQKNWAKTIYHTIADDQTYKTRRSKLYARGFS